MFSGSDGIQNPETIADGDSRRDDQEGVRERLGIRAPRLVDRVPGDDHPHDRGLAGAGRHLARQSIQARIGLGVGHLKLLLEPVGGDFGQVDQGLHGFTLAEEQPPRPRRFAPVEKQALCLRRDAPLAGRQGSPLVHMLANFVDQGVRCDLGAVLVEQSKLGLLRAAPTGGGDGNDLDAFAAPLQLHARRLAVGVKFVMTGRGIEGRGDDRVVCEPHADPQKKELFPSRKSRGTCRRTIRTGRNGREWCADQAEICC